ncbi:MAG: transcription factor kapC [Lasallia pustulata]|uniref:Putative transcription factor kapC n=1 Tax=Lasallia pustulata TaxID=136370 RepID=A0A5M8PV74_9LECA|nr:MAG: transcription factor kapC [Lasallia pustulata]
MQPALAPAPHPMQSSAQDSAEEQTLREHLLAQVQSPQIPPNIENLRPVNSASPHDRNIDPAIAGASMMSASAGESGGDDHGGDDRKGGKRELSTSKRAAQNRAAQRAFRQRKEGHIKKLEEQVKDYHLLSESYKAVQAENYQLRDYIINLQSRLIESQGEFPQPPSNIEIHHPRSAEQMHHMAAPTAPMGSSAVSQLQASAAQAVAGLSSVKHPHEEPAYLPGAHASKRTRTDENPVMQATTDPNLSVSTAEVGGAPVAA